MIRRDDLIRRGDAIEALRRERDIKALLDIPAVEPKQGEWMGDKCSVCGEERVWYGDNPPYCPDCGSRMRGADDDSEV